MTIGIIKPDWFNNANDTLIPPVTAKWKAYCRFLQTYTLQDKKEFRWHQRIVKKAVYEAKEEWISRILV